MPSYFKQTDVEVLGMAVTPIEQMVDMRNEEEKALMALNKPISGIVNNLDNWSD